MSLGKELTAQLQAIASGDRRALQLLDKGDPCTTLGVWRELLRARLEFFDHDRYSVTMRALEVGGATVQIDDLRAYLSAHAAEIARRLSYLEEPLAVWELEAGEQLVQMRSSPPHREAGAVEYWEVTLRVDTTPTARIARYRWAPGMVEREPVAYPATFPLLGRIADSLADSLQTIS